MNVKQERHDEAEIRELAAKFLEANKAKMANPQRTPQQPMQNMNILSFLNTDKAKVKNNSTTPESDSKNIDEDSVKGRFGWAFMGKMHIPYIMRAGEHYCAVRMVEMKVLNKLLNYLHQDLYNCTNIRSYYITDAEARLLNEINFKHCDYQFGREPFTSRDLIVRLTDANEFYKFLGHCYAKLVNTPDTESRRDRCGFIRINRESVVPYTVYNCQKYVPLFYFEGETDNLKLRADKLEGWDLSYLKFCCKVQGIRNELFAHDSCSVISLNDIKNYFPPGTVFEDYWPKKNVVESQLLITGTSNPQPIVQWTRQPTAPPITAHPPPSPKPATQAKAAANNSHMHNMHVFGNYGIAGQPPYHSTQPRTASSAVRATYPAASRHIRPYYSSITQAPPALVRSNSSGMAQYNAQTKAASNYMMMDSTIGQQQNSYHQATSQSTYPPPLMHMNGGVTRYETPQTRELQNTFSAVSNAPPGLVNPQPAHQASRTQTTTASEERTLLTTNGRPLISRSKLSGVVDQNSGIPYRIQKIYIDGKLTPCINMKPNVYTDMLVTLQDLVTIFFNNVPVQSCQQVMQVLGIEVYKANTSQMRALMENSRCITENESVALVQVRNVIDYMPQLKYMLSGLLGSDGGSKRQRNS